MQDYKELIEIGKQIGFSKIVCLNPALIELKPEVREMCKTNTCGMYGKNWSCPPGCGDLDVCREEISGYADGILVQTIGELEDEFDVERMLETEKRHKEAFVKFYEKLRERFPKVLALGSGCCTQCGKCSYPETACCFPEKRISSMEAYGMLVLQVCKEHQMDYYYGPKSIAYIGCFLF